jgi:ADP-ribose pyrophosphatase
MQGWKKLSEELVFDGYRKIVKKVFRLPNGESQDFDIVKEGRYVFIFALTADNQVILTKEYRPGPEKIFIDLPAGEIKPKEQPLKAAKRELLEETGYTGDFILINPEIFLSGHNTLQCVLFAATNCRKVSEQQLDSTEFIDIVTMDLASFLNFLKQSHKGSLLMAYQALYHLKLF